MDRRVGLVSALAVLIGLVIAGSYAVDPFLRGMIERGMNRRLKGYTARVGHVSFHPLGLGITLYDLVWLQDAHPDQPVFQVERLDASVEWAALLHRRLVANFALVAPVVYADRRQVESEAKDPTKLDEHGWQDAFEAIYPLKINHLRIDDGAITYWDRGQAHPVSLKRVAAVARNIRNVQSPDREYPSDLELEAVLFDSGRFRIDGHADFLAKPVVAMKATIELDAVPLDYVKPVLERYGVELKKGTMSAAGDVEYGRTMKAVTLRRATFQELSVGYVVTSRTAPQAAKAGRETVRATKETANAPDLFVRIGELRVVNGDIEVENRKADTPYELSITDLELTARNVSNQKSEGLGTIQLTGKFMGSGDTTARATFRPEKQGPDFDLDLEIEHTDLTRLNDLLRAHGKFDVAAGDFSFFTQLTVARGRVDGYVKPIFHGVKVSSPADQDKSFGQKLKEKMLDLAAKILKNRPRDEVATKVDISGPLQDPNGSTWQAVVGLLRNAFIRAILPGFDEQVAPVREGGGEPTASPRSAAR